MECPKCGCEIGNKSQCVKCGVNVDIYKKSKSISIKLYNKGLEQANNRDFSSAIISLNKSIKFDKSNYSARNVLGLIYLEIGEISKALKEWIISSSLTKSDNLAKDYIQSVQNSGRKLEKYNNAIKMYNQALVYLNQKSEDMAIIQLKKALDLNPTFIEAYNLLALCYINDKDNDKALTCIEKALEIDITNSKALKYYLEIKQSTQRPLKVDKSVKSASNTRYAPKPAIEKKIKRNNIFSGISSFIIGAVSIAVVMYILIIPSIKQESEAQIAQLTEKNISIEKKLNDTISQNKEIITKLQEDNKNMQNDNQVLNEQLQQKEQIQKVQQISTLYNNGNKEEAATLLLSLTDTISSFPEETKVLYNSLKEKILPERAKTYYNDGMSKYNSKKYDEAKILLEKSLAMSTEQSFSGDAIYFNGRIDEINKDIENAKANYQMVIDNYPKSSQFNNAKSRLNSLKR